jgi:hypothetical protein
VLYVPGGLLFHGGGFLPKQIHFDDNVSSEVRRIWCAFSWGMSREVAMERRFFMEAIFFVFLVKEGKAVVQLEERRRGFASLVVLDVQCTVWLVVMVEMVLRYLSVKDFINLGWLKGVHRSGGW